MALVSFEIGKNIIDKVRKQKTFVYKPVSKFITKYAETLNNVPIRIKFTYDEIELMFNEYLVENLDLDLHAYDEFTPNPDENGITIDLDELEEDCPAEFDLIVESLEGHYGKSIFLNEERTLNCILIMKKIFPKALVMESDEGIAVEATLEDLQVTHP